MPAHRYRRQDEIGTPICVTVDDETLASGNGGSQTVTIRHRDSSRQRRVPIAELVASAATLYKKAF